jgi:flagellar M-ring protein FliF
VEKTQETFNPDSKVVRSEQTEEESKENSPAEGNVTRETRTANYEMDRTVVKSVSAPGSVRKRVTVSVAVDGRWEDLPDSLKDKSKEPRLWKPRTTEEVSQLTELVRNAVGAQPGNDNVFVTCVKFENPVVEAALAEMAAKPLPWIKYAWWGVMALVVLAAFFLARNLIKILKDAIQPPAPSYAQLATSMLEVEEEDAEVTAEVVRVNDLLSRLEAMTKNEPGNFAKLIRTWLTETGNEKHGKR